MSAEEDARWLRSSWLAELGLEHLDIDRHDLARRLRAAARAANRKLPWANTARVSLTAAELAFLADLAEGKKRPNRRPVSADAAIRRQQIAQQYIFLDTACPGQEGWTKTFVADEFDVSKTYVTKTMKHLEPERRRELKECAVRILKVLSDPTHPAHPANRKPK